MKVRARCVQKNLAEFINPNSGETVKNQFAIFEGRDGEAIKVNLPKEEIEKLKVREEYEFEFSYGEAGPAIELPS